MTHEYTDKIAEHYAAFRPPLHEKILGKIIKADENFKVGLDIGCGTGYSSVALAKYCDQVFGIDPNQPMLDKAIKHPKISYFYESGDNIAVIGQDHFDVVSFAGSLFYAKNKSLKLEVLRFLNPDGVVLVYDFQVLINNLMSNIGIETSIAITDYNFEENLNDWPEFTPEIKNIDKDQLQLSASETAHIFLSNSYQYQLFQSKFHEIEPFDSLSDYLQKHFDKLTLDVNLYYARYRLEDKKWRA